MENVKWMYTFLYCVYNYFCICTIQINTRIRYINNEPSKQMSILIENQIPPEQRFTQKDGSEFHVFSTIVTDATIVDEWRAVHSPCKVLLDMETVSQLKNKRIEWHFDDDKTISAVEIKDES